MIQDQLGNEYSLGELIGKGGEGEVFAINGYPGLVAKLYYPNLRASRESKIRRMVDCSTEGLKRYTAWPETALYENATFVGFSMVNLSSLKAIHSIYSPQFRQNRFKDIDWRFLIYVARNVAIAMETLHQAGHIIGDINQGNIFVGEKAEVFFVDCDSFQIESAGRVDSCGVGVGHFTPPELQGLSSFSGLIRTKNHDYFGLAIVIFHLLFGGRHPFSGVPLSRDVGTSLEENIRNFRYAWSSDAKNRLIERPPKSLGINAITPDLANLFEKSFTEWGSENTRPSPPDWIEKLTSMIDFISFCQKEKTHAYLRHLAYCPWCKIEEKSKLEKGVQSQDSEEVTFQLNRINEASRAVAQLSPTSLLVPRLPMVLFAKPKGQLHGTISPLRILSRLVILGSFTTFSLSNYVVTFESGAITIFLLLLTFMIKSKSSIRSIREIKRKEKDTKKHLDSLVSQTKEYQNLEKFDKCKDSFLKAIESYRKLQNKLKQRVEAEKESSRDAQFVSHMKSMSVDNATISGVGYAKKASLASNGIVSAFDVEESKVQSCYGFGPILTMEVMAWKSSCVKLFVFNPNDSGLRNRISSIKEEMIRLEKTEMESVLRAESLVIAVAQEYSDVIQKYQALIQSLTEDISNFRRERASYNRFYLL